MSAKDLKDKYGKNRIQAAINAAIRAELIGGEKILDAYQLIKETEFAFEKRGWDEYLPFLRAALHELDDVCIVFGDLIRARYEVGKGRDDD